MNCCKICNGSVWVKDGGQVYVEKAYPNFLFGIEDKEFRDYERDIRRLYGVLFPKFEKILILGNKNDKIRVR